MSVSEEMKRLQQIVVKLRSPEGCPWDREQSHQSLKPYLIEEAYEVLEAIDAQDDSMLCEELGDLLLHIVMHSAMAQERGVFSLADVIKGISAKMVRRHPHVFGETKVGSVQEVWKNWDKIKKKEKKKEAPGTLLHSVPQALPALSRADKLQKRAARVGFDWDSVAGAWDKVHEEISEIEELLGTENKEQLSEELGDLLFSIVNVTRKLEIDAEEALRFSIGKFMKRFSYIEEKLSSQNKDMGAVPLEELDRLWNEGKKELARASQPEESKDL